MPDTIITVGNFDGVHIAHQRLLERARALDKRARIVALAFDPHPSTLIRPDQAPARLTTFDDRVALLLAAGADEVLRLTPTTSLLDLSPEAFVREHLLARGCKAVVEGDDFRFGRGRAGDVRTLAELGRTLGFQVEVVPPVQVALADQSIARVSSSLCRWLLRHGRASDAACILGRPHRVPGMVVRGERLGRTLGFPTLNIVPEAMLPADGVYSGAAVLPDGRRFPAAISLGSKPTLPGRALALEAHLLGAPRQGDAIAGLPEYGWRVTVEFRGWIRDQARYDSLDSLVDRIREDCRIALDPAAAPAWMGEVGEVDDASHARPASQERGVLA